MKSISTDSRYSPRARAIAVPPPNRHRCLSRSAESSDSSTLAMRRWCARSNKQDSLAHGGNEPLQEPALGGRHRVLVDVPPMALVQLQRLFGRQLAAGREVPSDLLELRIAIDTHRLRRA